MRSIRDFIRLPSCSRYNLSKLASPRKKSRLNWPKLKYLPNLLRKRIKILPMTKGESPMTGRNVLEEQLKPFRDVLSVTSKDVINATVLMVRFNSTSSSSILSSTSPSPSTDTKSNENLNIHKNNTADFLLHFILIPNPSLHTKSIK